LELTTEENEARTTWCDANIVKYVKDWARGPEDVENWLFNNTKWDTLERIEGKRSESWNQKPGQGKTAAVEDKSMAIEEEKGETVTPKTD
jgi:hypothetical protein